MTAKGDGLALLVAAVGIAAIAAFELSEGKMARIDFHAAQFDRLSVLENRLGPNELGCVAPAQANQWRFFAPWARDAPPLPVGTAQSPPPCAGPPRAFGVRRMSIFAVPHPR